MDDFKIGNSEHFNNVNNPEHYNQNKYQTLDEMLIVFGRQKVYDFCILNAWKYKSRALYKGNREEDIAKADRYLEYAYKLLNMTEEDIILFK